MSTPGEGGERRSHLIQGAIVVAVVAGLVALNKLLPNIDLQQALQDVSSSLGDLDVRAGRALRRSSRPGRSWGWCSPARRWCILGGAVAGQGETSIVLTIGVVWAAPWPGDTTSFLLGRRLGRGFIAAPRAEGADHATSASPGSRPTSPATAARRS